MAFEVTKVYKEQFPALRFIGRRYTRDDGTDAGFTEQWDEWRINGRFTKMQEEIPAKPYDESTIGLMTIHEDTLGFSYWIGMFYPSGTDVPEGYDFLDLPESCIGVGWVSGSDENGEIFGLSPHAAVCQKLRDNKIGDLRNDIRCEGGNVYCFFERYNFLRYTKKDANSNVILDYGNYFK